ncbi:MAG: nucleotide exchange factor GrpE [Betaproteobacteria bacterium]|nr:MAG: nucleotide exchange factor GrpE [Betaproteobacteria bacterium]
MPNPDPPTLPASEGDTPVDTSTPATQPAESPREEPKIGTVPDTGELLRQAELKAQEHHDAWLRAKAEADNIRKRTQIELANAYKYAIESLAAELLPVKDSLEATLAAGSAAHETLKSGVDLTLKQLSAVFEKANLKEINPIGEKFDPHRHQAISMLPSEKEPNTVINVLQKGYALHDRVIRPALVTIAGPKDAQA